MGERSASIAIANVRVPRSKFSKKDAEAYRWVAGKAAEYLPMIAASLYTLPAPLGEPPEGVGPGAVRFIDRGRYDERCLGAAILGLQSRGYLRVREQGERLRLERTGVALEWFPGEETLARRLVRERPADIRRHGRTLEEAGIRLAKELKAAYGTRRWVSHLPFAYAAAGIGIVTASVSGSPTASKAQATRSCTSTFVMVRKNRSWSAYSRFSPAVIESNNTPD